MDEELGTRSNACVFRMQIFYWARDFLAQHLRLLRRVVEEYLSGGALRSGYSNIAPTTRSKTPYPRCITSAFVDR